MSNGKAFEATTKHNGYEFYAASEDGESTYVHITSRCGKFTNSATMLENEGFTFDDSYSDAKPNGVSVPESVVAAAWAFLNKQEDANGF